MNTNALLDTVAWLQLLIPLPASWVPSQLLLGIGLISAISGLLLLSFYLFRRLDDSWLEQHFSDTQD